MWQKFEETMYIRTFGSLPVLFKPQLACFTRLTDNKHMPKVVLNEWTSLAFHVRNPLRINITLFDVTVLWKYTDQQQQPGEGKTEPFEISNELDDTSGSPPAEIAECSRIGEIALAPGDVYRVRLKIRAKRAHGHLHVLGIKYKLCVSDNYKMASQVNDRAANPNLDKELIAGKQLFELKGPRLNNNQQNMRSVVYDVDNRLNLKIINKTPLMQVR